MFINLVFDPNFPIENVEKNQFRIDFDANDTIDNLKVIISLKYSDLDPLFYDLYLNDKRIENTQKLIELNIQEYDILVIKAIGGQCPSCILI